eukprot:m51a1_g10412 putative endo- -beta-glucanase (583) ;mRNA; f:68291-70292
MRTSALCLLVLSAAAAASARYVLSETWKGSGFWDNFNFANAPDPTHGYVYYTSRDEAAAWQLISNDGDRSIIRADTSSISSGRGRASVRIESKKTFTTGLFVLDMNHMPTGCGTWPAYWTCGPKWPEGGEIDIIENVHRATTNLLTLHTKEGCDQSSEPTTAFTGSWSTKNCWINAPGQGNNQGCGIVNPPNTYGSALNQRGGGVWATLWTNEQIAVWYWQHDQVPGDLSSSTPNPYAWGNPVAKFTLGSNCPSNFFHDHRIIINLTFCGDWAGAVFASQCPAENARWGSCNEYVKNNPGAFRDAYWDINNIRIFYDDGRADTSSLQGHVSLKSAFGTFASAQDNGKIQVDRSSVQAWEAFDIVPSPVRTGAVAIRCAQGKYVSANRDSHEVTCDRDRADDWESFYPEPRGNNQWVFRATSGVYLEALDNPRVMAAYNTVAQGWETFTVGFIESELQGRVSLKTAFGTFVSAQDDGKIVADRSSVQAWEVFTIENSPARPSAIAFKSAHGKYISANPDNHQVTCDRDSASDWESFFPESRGNNQWVFRATNGKYLQTLDNPRVMAAYNSVPQGWETFTIQHY